MTKNISIYEIIHFPDLIILADHLPQTIFVFFSCGLKLAGQMLIVTVGTCREVADLQLISL